MLHTSYTHYN